MRVLNVLASAQRRGAEVFAYELTQALAGRGLESEAVCLIAGGQAVARLNAPILGRHRYAPNVILKLRRRAARSSVVVAHGSSTLLACGVGLLGLGVPFIYTNIGDPRHWAATPARQARVRWLLGRASAVAAISPTSAAILVDQFGVPASRVRVIPNGRSAGTFRPSTFAARQHARASLDLPDDHTIIAMVGALSAEKRVDVAVRALAQMPDTMLVVAGDGPERARLTNLAAACAPGRVRFVGAVSSIVGILDAADVLVLTSESEGVPGVLIEAGLAGVPVVSTDVGFVRDVVVPGVTGEVVQAGRPELLVDAIHTVLGHRQAYALAARAHCAARFDLAVIADLWRDMLKDVQS